MTKRRGKGKKTRKKQGTRQGRGNPREKENKERRFKIPIQKAVEKESQDSKKEETPTAHEERLNPELRGAYGAKRYVIDFFKL